eukprot:6449863-Pyramimonas_sp.AAC.1
MSSHACCYCPALCRCWRSSCIWHICSALFACAFFGSISRDAVNAACASANFCSAWPNGKTHKRRND